MRASRYAPDAGDVVWLQFSPQVGHEQVGQHPALVLSPAKYNRLAGLMICCPMTTHPKVYAFEVAIAGTVPSAVLADQMKSVDWRSRRVARKGKVSADELAEVRAKIMALIG